MDVKALKNYIFENDCVEQILESVNCHHIKYHYTGGYWTCCNYDGDNPKAVVLYDNEYLTCVNYTRQMIKGTRQTDIIDLVCYNKDLSFPQGVKHICEVVGLSYYHNFEDDMPESFKILKLLDDMKTGETDEEKEVLVPISESVLSYYQPYVNELFCEDNISFETQKEFEVGFDPNSNRYTIPIRSELGDLVGVKGRYFYRNVPDCKSKYLYIEPCAKSMILYGLHKTIDQIKSTGRVYVVEAEKAVMQLWSYGYMNSVSCGGKIITAHQRDLLVRLGADIVLCFDKDVTKADIEETANLFPDGVPIFYMYDEDNILEEKESPSDNPSKWRRMVDNNIYKLR